MGLPKRGLSLAGFFLYLIVICLISFVALVVFKGPIIDLSLFLPFLAILFAVYGAIMYWTYSSNKAFK
jgi:peptidoglycan/LPS O-acetylase OafA/YrhL